LNVALAVSVVLLATTLSLWVLGCCRAQYVSVVRPWARSDPLTMRQTRYNVGVGWDGVSLARLVEVRHYDDGPTSAAVEKTLRASEPPRFQWYGTRQTASVGREFGPDGGVLRGISVAVLPGGAGGAVLARFWFLVVVFGTVPAWWGYARHREARFRGVGQCRACGYDLRATPERCPECGTPVGDPYALVPATSARRQTDTRG